jgi:integrase
VLVLANTGLRVGEARNLKWSDIEYFPDDDGYEQVAIMARGKTGSREVVARTPDVKEYFGRILNLRCEELGSKPSGSDYAFLPQGWETDSLFQKGLCCFSQSGESRV